MAQDRRADWRSPEAALYRGWYKSTAWARIRELQLLAHPLCERCLAKRKAMAASVVHHKEPHRGNVVRFFNGPFESLCKRCHDSDAQSEERIGYSKQIGADGWPVDNKH